MSLNNPTNTVVTDETLGQSQYDFSYLAFPNDLGVEYHGHYMVININVPVTSSGEQRGAFSSQSTILPNEYSKVDVLRFGNSSALSALGGADAQGLSIPTYTRRIAQSIALYMPNNLVHSNQNRYEEVSLTTLGGQLLTGAISGAAGVAGTLLGAATGSVIPALGTAVGAAAGGVAGNFIGGLVSGGGKAIGQIAQVAGYPINPRVEVLFASTQQRQFVFDVLMAPRNEKESLTIKKIIKTLRFHAAPEINNSGILGGMALIPPAEFDITFFNKGAENVEIPRINTCVMDRIEVDYAPQGVYSTFSNGHPVAVRLLMGFREIEIPHKKRILQGM